MRKNILYALAVVLMLMLSACNLETQAPTSTPTPEVITLVVTATPEPATATPVASETPIPTATTPPTATAVPATATPKLLHFYVSGTVWHDECPPGQDGGGPTPTALPPGCVSTSGGGSTANGTFDAGESGIAGVTVRIELECSYGAFTTVTDGNGYYSMSFTVPEAAGVVKQRICLSVDALNDGNDAVLIPGGWTYPATNGVALYDVVIPVEQENTYNFGWDFQFK